LTAAANAWLRGTDIGLRCSHSFVAGSYTSFVARTRAGPKNVKNGETDCGDAAAPLLIVHGSLDPSTVVAPPIT
jgi:hypothetical protein